MTKKIKLFEPSIDNHDIEAAVKTIKSKFWASGSGIGKVEKFEKKFQKYLGSHSCIAVNSGTAALHLALSLFDLRGKEVILPSLSFVSTAHSVIYNNAKPVFVDVEPKTLCLDPELIKKAITKKTALILPVHFGGMPCELNSIIDTCKQFNLKLVEDAAHAAGTIYKNNHVGKHGDAVCFSFHPVKNLSMPTGGAIALNGNNIKQKSNFLKSLRWCGITNRIGLKYDISMLGWNYYMNEISASIGLKQLNKLNKMNEKRKYIAKRYHNEISLENKMPFNHDCSYHLYWIQVRNRLDFIKKMNDNGIETGIHYFPIHKTSYYKTKKILKITEKTSQKIVSLPMHLGLSNSQVDKIIKLTNSFAK